MHPGLRYYGTDLFVCLVTSGVAFYLVFFFSFLFFFFFFSLVFDWNSLSYIVLSLFIFWFLFCIWNEQQVLTIMFMID